MSNRPLFRVRRNICILLLSMLVLSWGFFVFSFHRDYRTIEQQCFNHLTTLSIGLEEHTRHIVQVTDILLLEIVRHYFLYSVRGLQETVGVWRERSPDLAGLVVVDVEAGEVLFSLEGVTLPEAFAPTSFTASGSREDVLQIAAELFTGSDGRNLVALFRHFRSEDRDLVAVIFLHADSLLDFHADLDLGSNGAVAIYHQQGFLLARKAEGGQLAGRSYVESLRFRKFLPEEAHGFFKFPEAQDGVSRIAAHRRLADLPFIVTVDVSAEAIFFDWQKRLINFLLIQSVVSLAILSSLVMLFRTLSRVDNAEIELEEREEHFRAVANSSVDAVISIDAAERVRFWSVGAEKIFGCTSSEAVNMPIACFLQFTNDEKPLTLKQLAEVTSSWSTQRTMEVQGQHKNGTIFPTELSASLGAAAGKPLYTLIVRDVTERRQMEKRIKRLASHDNLTGLPNRTLLMDRLQVAMAQVRRQGGQFALLFVDLDKFKPVNDSYGHDVGDRVLQQVATRMLDTVRESDTVARIGGDEFALLLSNVEDRISVSAACENLLTSLRRTFIVSGIRVEISCSIGAAFFDGRDSHASVLIQRADNAMYAAKRAGKNGYAFAAEEVDDSA